MQKIVDSALDHLALMSDDTLGWWLDVGGAREFDVFQGKIFL